MPIIESQKNETFKKLLSLTGSRGLKKEGLFLLCGEKLIHEFLINPSLDIVYEVLTPSMTPLLQDDAKRTRLYLSSDLFSQLDVLGTHYNILVLQQPVLPAFSEEQIATYNPKTIEVVIPVGDPGNLGALLRSCEAFGISRIFLTQEAAHPFLPKSVKASAGSVLRLSLSLAPSLRNFPRHCIALDMDGTPINNFTWPSKGLLVIGEEGSGLEAHETHAPFIQRLSIPTEGVESLNVVVAASIALAYRYFSRQKNSNFPHV